MQGSLTYDLDLCLDPSFDRAFKTEMDSIVKEALAKPCKGRLELESVSTGQDGAAKATATVGQGSPSP